MDLDAFATQVACDAFEENESMRIDPNTLLLIIQLVILIAKECPWDQILFRGHNPRYVRLNKRRLRRTCRQAAKGQHLDSEDVSDIAEAVFERFQNTDISVLESLYKQAQDA